jgi:hypothetical protein
MVKAVSDVLATRPPDALRPTSTLQAVAPDIEVAIQAVVGRLAKLQRVAALQLALDVGCLIVDALYGGDVEKIRLRGRKDHSFRALAAHPDVPFSRAVLWRSVAVYELVRRHPELVRREELTLAHFRAVLGAPPELQAGVLSAAAAEGRSSAWVSARVAEAIAPRPTRSRRARNEWVQAALRLAMATSKVGSPPLAPTALGSEDEEHLREAVAAVRAWCDSVEVWFDR